MAAIGTLPVVLGTGVHGSRPAASAVGKGGLYSCTTHSLVYQTDGSTWTTWATLGTGTGVATDPIWDTAGDIAAATGADAAAKLPIGNVGGALRRINGALGYDSRTSFPTAATGDVIYRSDLSGMWYYNGTIWLSLIAQQVSYPLAVVPPLAATGVLHRMAMPGALGGSDVYLGSVIGSLHVVGGTALSASHKWVGTVTKSNTAGGSSLGTITIDSGALNQWRPLPALTINAAAAIASGYIDLEINWTKTGTPGTLYANAILVYRTIAT